ncbi:MAG: branched-chain amino acid ABC transporter permease [Desulfobacterales bacterium]|nr:MAG: branched-chain amino acid ABC transporter permease [Desulfobacterales bacterium]
MQKINYKQAFILGTLPVVLISAPFAISGYKVDLLTNLLINIILVSSFRLITTTGGWSLAHIPMMGCGAYATALLAGTLGVPFWFSLPLAGLAAALAGLAISYPLARTRGFAFFVASFAAGEAIRLCWIRFKIPFGGHKGLTVPAPVLFQNVSWLDFEEAVPYYFLALAITIVSLAIMYRFDKSRIGDTWRALASEEKLAKSVGINITKYKMLSFSIGSFFAGVAGVILAHRLWAIEPRQFGFNTTLYLLVWVVFGGSHTFAGPIIGVVVLTFLAELLRPLVEWVPMIFGTIIILILIFLPNGLESLPAKLRMLK